MVAGCIRGSCSIFDRPLLAGRNSIESAAFGGQRKEFPKKCPPKNKMPHVFKACFGDNVIIRKGKKITRKK